MKEIFVYADWQSMDEPFQIGKLRAQISKGEEIFSFEYNEEWLSSGMAQEIDPDLKLYSGPQYINDSKPNFGLFLDSSPDRWGRLLITRKAAIIARTEGKKKRKLFESDFLLEINDETRMGALRFKLEPEGEFLSNHKKYSTPPFTSIRALEQASKSLEDDNFSDDAASKKWLTMLYAPGSSLGGARPKASVVDPKGQLWIAKFPSKNDDSNIGAWEKLVNQMALDLGINAATGQAKVYSQKQHTYLSKRFDRTVENKRIHFASALSLLGYKDGHSHKDGGSYLELVELLEQFGSNPTKDIRELWTRIVFSVAISNTDDHLRNHGFLLDKQGWNLSPAYDINPNSQATGLSLNISEDDNSLDYDLCLEVIEFFRWNSKEAKSFINKTKKVVGQWKERADNFQIKKREISKMASAFNF